MDRNNRIELPALDIHESENCKYTRDPAGQNKHATPVTTQNNLEFEN